MNIIDRIKNYAQGKGWTMHLMQRSREPFEAVAHVYRNESHVITATVIGPRMCVGFDVEVSPNGESPMRCGVQLGLCSLYLCSQGRIARRLAGLLGRHHYSLSAYEVDGEFVLSGHRGTGDDFPELYVNLNKSLFGEIVGEERPVPDQPAGTRELHFAEGAYTVRFAPREIVIRRPRWPISRVVRMVDWQVEGGVGGRNGIPIPGKGETGYDIDEDAVYSGGVQAQTIEEAAGKVYGRVMRDRVHRGGVGWLPERRPSEPAPTMGAN